MVASLIVWCWSTTAKGDWARYSSAFAGISMVKEALLGAALVLLGHVAGDHSVSRVLFLCLHFGKTLLLATVALTAT
jgi:heme A synthase